MSRGAKINHTLKHIKSLKNIIKKITQENGEMVKQLSNILNLEEQINSLKQKVIAMEYNRDILTAELNRKDKEVSDVHGQLKDVRIELGEALDEVRMTHHEISNKQAAIQVAQDVIARQKSKIAELEKKIVELSSDDRSVAKLRRRLQEAHADSMALVRQLRSQGQEPVRRPKDLTPEETGDYGTTTGRFKANDPNLSNVPRENGQ
jgi:chromosome segregation ATPase